jgi:putative transposase
MNVSIPQIAEALKVSERAIRKRKDNQGWKPSGERIQGGGDLYDLDLLPLKSEDREKVCAHLQAQHLVAVTQTLPAPAAQTALVPAGADLPPVTALKDWQREVMEARLWLMRMIERASASMGVSAAIREIVRQAESREIPELVHYAALANARKGEGRTLSVDGVNKWWAKWLKADKNSAALAPKGTEKFTVPAWAPAFLAEYRQPQKPSVAGALEKLKRKGLPEIPMPTRGQVDRFLEKLGAVEREKGRRSGQELRSIRPYIIRDTSDMLPGEVYITDGLNFKAWGIGHPRHGRPFSPEICDIKDVATRRIVGWSAGLAESAEVMAAALKNAVETAGVPLLYYHDRGPGYENGRLQHEITGVLARIGSTDMKSIALQSQARGQIEKLRLDLWHKAAKEFLTYKGREMDRITKNRVFRIIKKDLREQGTCTDFVMPWPEFLLWIQDRIDEYNDRPHSALPRIRDEHDGRMRNMTPNEAWAQAINDGWQPMMLDPGEIADLFMPEQLVTVHRGMVRLFTNTYFNAHLEEFHGHKVRVGYDVHDPRAVRVRDVQGRLVCWAKFEGNKRRYIPKSVAEQALDRREQQRLQRLQLKIDEVKADRLGYVEVETVPDYIEIPQATVEFAERLQAREEKNAAATFMPSSDADAYFRLVDEHAQGAQLTERENKWMADYESWQQTGRKVGLHRDGWQPFAERYRKAIGN